ncbi:MAG: hypothetical protein HPY55_01875 [Firmicutes bacterium]|nr:hypothetical protein [Bacillota bacterium]
MGSQTKVVVCGGGNAAHVLVPAIKEAGGTWVAVLATFGDESQRIANGVAQGGIIAAYRDHHYRGVPDLVTSSPSEAIPSADVVIVSVPAFAHAQVVESIAPYLKCGAFLGAMPSRSGFEFYATNKHLRDRDITLFGFQTLPWACRVADYGRLVNVLGRKNIVSMGAFPTSKTAGVAQVLASITGLRIRPANSMLSISLGNVGQIIHPGIMYGFFHGREDLDYDSDSVPLFYQSVNRETSMILDLMSREILAVARLIEQKHGVNLGDVIGLKQWLLDSYGDQIRDKTDIQTCFATNSAYEGIKAPVIGEGNKFRPDFKSRYLTEDVPYGLVVTRGVAAICGIETPVIDRVIDTCSHWMGVQYLIGGKPCGRDVSGTRHPVVYGIRDIDRLIATSV